MVVLDTDIVIGALRGNPAALAAIKELKATQELCITSITAFELLRGVHRGKASETRRALMLDVISSFFVIDFTYIDADAAARIETKLRLDGTPIGTFDTMIAACCTAAKKTLVTRNAKHFAKIPGLKVEKW